LRLYKCNNARVFYINKSLSPVYFQCMRLQLWREGSKRGGSERQARRKCRLAIFISVRSFTLGKDSLGSNVLANENAKSKSINKAGNKTLMSSLKQKKISALSGNRHLNSRDMYQLVVLKSKGAFQPRGPETMASRGTRCQYCPATMLQHPQPARQDGSL
jgi:hypothetical protein